MIEWVKEMLASKHTFQSNNEETFHDKVFANEMNKRMNETAKNYDSMLFREALRTGFFEMQAARDKVLEKNYYEIAFKAIRGSYRPNSLQIYNCLT